MLSYEWAKTLHFVSIIGLFLSTGLSYRTSRKTAMLFQTLFWVLVFASAWELVSVLELHKNFPLWGKIKTLLWILFGVLGVLVMKRKSMVLYSLMFIAGSVAVMMAVLKPV